MIAQRMSLMVVLKKKKKKQELGAQAQNYFGFSGGLESIPSATRQGGVHPGQLTHLIHRDRRPFTHTHNTCRQFRLTYQLKPLICKPEYSELTQTPGQHTNAT